MQTRRRYLGAVSLGIAGLAGCLSESDGPGGDGDATTTDGTTARPDSPDDEPVMVSNPVVRKRATHYSWPGSTGVLAPTDEQFVVASVAGPESADLPAFTLEAGDEEFSPGVDVAHRNGTFAGRRDGSVLENDGTSGYLAFRVPSPLDVDDARIVRDDAAGPTPLADDELATLTRPAATFELDTLDLPDAVERPDPVDVSLSVTNVADVDGRFLAGLHWPTEGIADDDETTVLERTVAAGETTTFSLTLGTGYAANETSEHSLTIDGSVSADRTVEIRVDDTTTADALDH